MTTLPVLLPLALVLSGHVASLVLLPGPVGPALRTAWTLLLALVVVPWSGLALAAAGLATFSAGGEFVVAAAVTTAGAGWLWRTKQRAAPERPGDPSLFVYDPLVLGGATLALFLAAAWYSDAKALVSHASYVASGQAECFYMLSFRLWGVTNPGADTANLREAFSIISTPGNALFTAGLLPAVGLSAFGGLYALAAALLFTFTYAALRSAGISFLSALLVAAFAVANPYTLSIEELDRNVLALVLSAALFHATVTFPDRHILHGLLLGLAAGTGLRFLPATLALGVAFNYWNRARPRRDWAIAFGVALVTFLPNVPHLLLHGLHSLGESHALPRLAVDTGPLVRTPFLALPNALFYPMQLLRLLGAASIALALFGAFQLFRDRRALVVPLLSGLVPTFVVLATQRDWIEGDKHRILLWALLPLFVALGAALDALAKRPLPSLAGVALALAATVGAGLATARVDTPSDATMRARKPLYQSETSAFAAMNRAEFSRFGLFPSYDKLFLKPDLVRKARYSSILRQQLGVDEPAPEPTPGDEPLVDLSIDLAALVGGPDALSDAPTDARPFLSLARDESLLDVYHHTVTVPWQPEPLTVTVLPSAPMVFGLREITLELNAFRSLGPDDDGFERVVPLHAPATTNDVMRALPYRARDARLLLRVPRNFRVVLRDWYLQPGSGVPYRTDGWEIRVPLEGPPTLAFFPMEPESHL